MKKLFILTLGVSLSLLIYSQDLPAAWYRTIQDHTIKITDTEVYLMDSVHLYRFGDFITDSILGVREFLAYTPHGAILADSNLGQFYDTANWAYMDKREYNYDGMNRLDYKTAYIGSWVQNIWIPEEQHNHTYIGSTEQIDFTIVWEWDPLGTYWEKHDSIVFTYDQQNQIDFEYQYHWNADSGKYIIQDYIHYAYNALGLHTSDTTFSYWTPGTPTPNFLRNYEYDVNGWESVYRSYNWDGISSWIPMEKHEYTKLENGYPLTDHRFEWDQVSSQWKLYEYGWFTYDENENMELWQYFELNDSTGLFEKDFTGEFFWSLHTIVDIPEMRQDGLFSIYPNPSDGIITVETVCEGTLAIYGMDGKLYSNVRLPSGSSTLDLSDLPPGMYMIISPARRSYQKLLIR